VEDAQSHKEDIVLCYLDFIKGTFLFTYHKQLVRVLEFLGFPDDFTRLVSDLCSRASMKFVTPHGHTPSTGVKQGIFQVEHMSPLLFDLMIEPPIRWL
jgi:hypothetical protein